VRSLDVEIQSNTNLWLYSPDHGQPCRVVEAQALWGEMICRIWLPDQDAIVRVRADRLKPLKEAGAASNDGIIYTCAAARIADALTQDVLLAPIESSVIPLPHQIRALSRAVAGDSVRFLLSDEVGLGKTIEAGLIMREMKLRGLVARTLVVAPKGLVTQWVAEMQTHFAEEFRLLAPGDFSAYRRIAGDENIWRSFHQVICSMDSVKPLDNRRGWTKEQVAEYNRDRFEDLMAAGWDLVIVDEAHRLGGSTEQVARYRLGTGLAEAAPYLLLLTATPHQGKTDAFHRLVSLLDTEAFPDTGSISRERVQPYVIRTEKRRAIDAEGKPLFKARRTQLIPVSWQDRHQEQRSLYAAVTEYVREGYNQALLEKRSYIGFLMILMQRLVVSSTRSIRTTLERRLEALQEPEEQLSLFPSLLEEEWADMDGQEQIDALLKTRMKALRNEREEVKLLLGAAKRCEGRGPDAKAEALLDWIYRLQQEEADPELKVLIFTEFIPTQGMLRDFLAERGFAVVCLNGSMDMDERKRVQESFAKESRVLISTDAGGEGLNLQFCHVVVNYDIPWNPMRLEQRIGRVDRIGQNHEVRAINFVFEDSVEHRVREVLEQKLAVIFSEFGIDKAGDVLDSAQAGQIFDDLYVEAILHPEEVERSVEKAVTLIEGQAREIQASASILESAEVLDPTEAQRMMSHPLPYWVECMAVSHIRSRGGEAERLRGGWRLKWPDGTEDRDVVFVGKDAEKAPAAKHLTLEDSRIRGLAMRLPRFAPGQPVPIIGLPALPADVRGIWSLWRISIQTDEWSQRRIMSLFAHDDGRMLAPTARRIWDEILTADVAIRGYVEGGDTDRIYHRALDAAVANGELVYGELQDAHRKRLRREQDKGEYAFAVRRSAVERIGLPEVRSHRLSQLSREEGMWRERLAKKMQASPDMAPLILVRLEGGTTLG